MIIVDFFLFNKPLSECPGAHYNLCISPHDVHINIIFFNVNIYIHTNVNTSNVHISVNISVHVNKNICVLLP